MTKDERFPPNRSNDERGTVTHIESPQAHLTIKPSGPRRAEKGEKTVRGQDLESRLRGAGGPLIEFALTKAERNNLPPEQPERQALGEDYLTDMDK